MELILDGKTIEVLEVYSFMLQENVRNLELVFLEEEGEIFKTSVQKKYDLIQLGEDKYEDMYFYCYASKDNELSVFSFVQDEKIGNELTIEEIFKMHSDSKVLINLLKEKKIPEKNNDLFQKVLRKTYDSIEINRFGGYTMLSEDWIDDFAQWIGNRSVLEIGAGIGALAFELQKRNIDITPIDNRSWDRFNWKEKEDLFTWTKVFIEDYFAVASKYVDKEIIILSYPVQGEYSYNILRFIRMMNPNSLIVFIGPFNKDYTSEEFINEVTEIEDEQFSKIAEKYCYWTGHKYMKSEIKLLK